MSKATVLNDVHRAMGARMVDFGGWAMPVSYGSQIEEHHAVRRDCGLFDISHMLAIDVTGTEARPFLSRLLANDVGKLREAGKALYSCLLNENGGVIDDLIVYFLSGCQFRLVVNAGNASQDLAWLLDRQTAWQHSVTITPRYDCAMLAVQGPHTRVRLWQALPQARTAAENLQAFFAVTVDEYFLACTGYTGEDGFEIMLPASAAAALWQALLAAGATPCGLGARDTLRLEAGMNLHGQDMDAATSPFEAGLGWTVALSGDRDFVGKSALLGTVPNRQLLGLVLLEKGVLRSHQPVVTAAGPGLVTSGTFSPTLEKSIALARVPLGVQPGDQVSVEIRQRQVAAQVVKPPFVRHGQILV